jgi:multicomponent Na+:H+ antiporter subunit D
VLVLVQALAPADRPLTLRCPVRPVQELAALALALCSLLLGLFPWEVYLSVPAGTVSSAFALKALPKVLGLILAGAVLAVVLGRWGHRQMRGHLGTIVAMAGPVRHPALAFSGIIERTDSVLRQWPAATLSLLTLTIIFGLAMLAGR